MQKLNQLRLKKKQLKQKLKFEEEVKKEEDAKKEEADSKEALTEALKQLPDDNELTRQKSKRGIVERLLNHGELKAGDILKELADDNEKLS